MPGAFKKEMLNGSGCDWNLDVNFISYFGSCGHRHGDEV